MELSCYSFVVMYLPGKENAVVNALCRVCSSAACKELKKLKMCHPGVTRMIHMTKTKNLPCSAEDVRENMK